MSYKYSNIREYQGKLLFEDRKNQKRLTINSADVVFYSSDTRNVCFNSEGIQYTQHDYPPDRPFFELRLDGYDSSLIFYRPDGDSHGVAEMSCLGLSFDVSGAKNQRVGVSALTGPYVTDSDKKKQCQMSADGLIITDDATGQKCILKFENGVLKINGKEIATVENP